MKCKGMKLIGFFSQSTGFCLSLSEQNNTFMIQRIQTVWLLLAAICLFALFLFPYWQFADSSGMGHALKVTGAYGTVDGQAVRQEAYWLQMISVIIVGLFPLYI